MKKTLAVLSLTLASSVISLPTFAATHEEAKPTVNPHKHEADKKVEAKSKEVHSHVHKHDTDAKK